MGRAPWSVLGLSIVGLGLVQPLHGALDRGAPVQGSPEVRQQEATRAERRMDVEPRLGTVGSLVTVRATGLPAMTPVQVAIGATRTGFEEFGLHQTDDTGSLEATLEVPPWAEREQTHRFLIFNLYFSTVLARSGVFHVTDSEGGVVREGEVSVPSSECVILEGDDGERYRLTASTDGLEPGSRVVVEGVLSESTEGCGEGLSLDLKPLSFRYAGGIPRP